MCSYPLKLNEFSMLIRQSNSTQLTTKLNVLRVIFFIIKLSVSLVDKLVFLSSSNSHGFLVFNILVSVPLNRQRDCVEYLQMALTDICQLTVNMARLYLICSLLIQSLCYFFIVYCQSGLKEYH